MVHSGFLSLEQVNQERQRFDALRRKVFVVGGTLGVLLITYGTIDEIVSPSRTPLYSLFLGSV